MIEQVYIKYTEWEDYINGMWRSVNKEQERELLETCIKFTGDHVLYGLAMKQVTIEWPRTMINALTNSSINQRAFVGHCACQLRINCPEYITRMAWREITNKQRYDADFVAQKTINEWRINYNKECKIKLINILSHGKRDVIQMEFPMMFQ